MKLYRGADRIMAHRPVEGQPGEPEAATVIIPFLDHLIVAFDADTGQVEIPVDWVTEMIT